LRIECPAQLILHDFITLVTSCEGYRLWSFSFYKFLHPSVSSSLVASDHLLGACFSRPSVPVLQVRGKQYIMTTLI
jgi:hypothetical protein